MNVFGLGTPELILILVVLLLFFGKNKLPELAHSVGRSFKELKSGFDTTPDSTPAETDKKDAGKPSK